MVETEKGFATEMKDIYKLRNKTRIGEFIRFKTDRFNRGIDGDTNKSVRVVRGVVVKKFPYVFLLNTGETYTWVDYYFGR